MFSIRFKKPGNYFFILPWIAFIPWYGMLIAMLICWAAQGHPIYWFIHTYQFPVYISDIGATNLRPLFIACAAWQGLGYCLTVASEYFQRAGHWPFQLNKVFGSRKFKADEDYAHNSNTDCYYELVRSEYVEMMVKKNYFMPPWYTKDERNLIFASFVFAVIGELALLFCSIFSTAKHHHVHLSMVGIFVVALFFSVCCLSAEYFMMGRHYAILHPLANEEDTKPLDQLRCNQWSGHVWNKFTISASVKVVWLVLSVVWAICFGAVSDSSISSCFEWLLAFWFGILFILISIDFYLGGRYKKSLYFYQVQSFEGFYKYEQIINNTELTTLSSDGSDTTHSDFEFKNMATRDVDSLNAVTV